MVKKEYALAHTKWMCKYHIVVTLNISQIFGGLSSNYMLIESGDYRREIKCRILCAFWLAFYHRAS